MWCFLTRRPAMGAGFDVSEDGVLPDDDGLATMVTRLAGADGEPTMRRIELAWRNRPIVPPGAACADGGTSPCVAADENEAQSSSSSAYIVSHETAELRGCGAGSSSDGRTAVVHRFRVKDRCVGGFVADLAHEAVTRMSSGVDPGETVSNRGGSWHSAANVLLEEGGWPRDATAALGATIRDAIRLAWVAAGEDDASDDDASDDDDGGRREERSPGRGLRMAAKMFAASAAVQAWLNVSPTGGYHRRHEHGAALYSGALYCAVPSQAKRRGADEEGGGVHSAALVFCPEGKHTPRRFAAVSPEVGTLVLFPGWLVHCVLPMRTDGRAGANDDAWRVSASFNAYRKGDALRAHLKQHMMRQDAVAMAKSGVLRNRDTSLSDE